MNWYAAHALMAFVRKDGNQTLVYAFENILLISASSHKEATQKAEQFARRDEGDSQGSLTIDGHPADLKFMGIRKTVLCADPDQRPTDGTEISYTELEFSNFDDLQKHVHGEDVTVQFCDNLPSKE